MFNFYYFTISFFSSWEKHCDDCGDQVIFAVDRERHCVLPNQIEVAEEKPEKKEENQDSAKYGYFGHVVLLSARIADSAALWLV